MDISVDGEFIMNELLKASLTKKERKIVDIFEKHGIKPIEGFAILIELIAVLNEGEEK